jgi:hypothetical protein
MTKILKEIIELPFESRDFRPSRIGTKTFKINDKDVRLSLNGDAGMNLGANEPWLVNSKTKSEQAPSYQQWRAAEDKGYLKFKNKRIYLLPTEPDTSTPFEDYGLLVHLGLVVNGTDNFQNLSRYGVFGNPYSEFPTYIMKHGANIMNNGFGLADEVDRIALFIDKKQLLKKRSIFIDPESIGGDGSDMVGDIEGHSFFVLGGIPKEAIHSYRYYPEGFVTLFE